MKKITTLLLGAALVAILAGCTSANAEIAASPSASPTENPYGGFAVDNPAPNEIILTVKGPTETDEYSITDLEKLVADPITIDEPFIKAKQTFTGVPLKVLFDAAGITGDLKVSTIALNDYKFDDSVANFVGSNGILAITRDAALIPMDQGGPVRIVFPTGSKYFDYLDSWNWSLRTIEVVK